MKIQRIREISEDVVHLIDDLDKYQNSLYPKEDNYLDPIHILLDENVFFLGVYSKEQLTACCAVKKMNGYGEIKRLYVKPEFRGIGLAKKLIMKMEEYLKKEGIKYAKAETGVSQPEAIRLYEDLDYERSHPFGDYSENPHSLFFIKNLSSSPHV